MPSPVSFLLSLSTFPVNYTATPQQFAQDLVDRLTITPSAPWNSFQVGAVVSSSNIGPILYDLGNGMKWIVWDDATGDYAELTVDGTGVLNNSIPLSALAKQVPGGLLSYDASGNPVVISPAVSGTGYVLTQQASGLFQPVALPTSPGSTYFEVTNSGILTFVSSTAPAAPTAQTVGFNSVLAQSGVVFDVTNHWVPIPSGQVWYFFFQVQLDYAGSSTTWQVTANITTSTAQVVGGLVNSAGSLGRQGLHVGGIIATTSGAQNVYVQLLPTETTGSSTNITMGINANNQRFGGFRLA